MKYDKAKNIIKKYDKVILGGPDRAGTTITAKILCHDLDYDNVPEAMLRPTIGGATFIRRMIIPIGYKLRMPRPLETGVLPSFLRPEYGRLLFHATEWSFCFHALPLVEMEKEIFDKTIIVFVRRNVQDIIDSQDRLKYPKWESESTWTEKCESIEIKCYKTTIENEYLPFEIKDGERIAELKYRFWDEYQKPLLKGKINWVDLDYESLKTHSLWVKKKKRLNFKSRQIEL